MTETKYTTYEEAARDYLTKFRALRDAPATKSKSVTRGAADISIDTLVAKADEIAEISANMVSLAKNYLEAPDPALREGISGQLLAQVAAEMQVATELMHIAESEAATSLSTDKLGTPRAITRAARGANLREAIDGMEKVMAMPVSAGLLTSRKVRRAVSIAGTPEEAKKALQQKAKITTGAISQRVVEVGANLAFDLVFKTEWAAVIRSFGYHNKDVVNLLESLKTGANALMQRVISTASKTILNVYGKILALLGKEAEDEARSKVKDLLEQIQKAAKIELFGQLVGKLYRVNAFEDVLPEWLEATSADPDKINATTKDVEALSDKFTVLVGRINTVGDIIGLAKFAQVQLPQLLAVFTTIRILLLEMLVYSGYDYIGYEQARFPNFTKGVAEIIKENLVPVLEA